MKIFSPRSLSQSISSRFRKRIGKAFAQRKTLRNQLTFSILLILVPGFLVSAYIINQIAIDRLRELTQARMAAEADLISFGIKQWADANRITLKLLASQDALKLGNIEDVSSLFNTLDRLYPNREWRYWSAGTSPRLLAYTGGKVTPDRVEMAEKRILSRTYFREALEGNPGYAVVNSFASGEACIMFAQPIFNSSQNEGQQKSPSGILLSCILLKNLSRDIGLQKMLKDFSYLNNSSNETQFTSSDPIGASLMLVSSKGHVLFPSDEYAKSDTIPQISAFLDTEWKSLFEKIRVESYQISTDQKTRLDPLRLNSNSYLIALSRADNEWSTVLVVNENILYAGLYSLRLTLFITSFVSLVLVVVAIRYDASRITSPIQLAGRALKSISRGDFDTHIPHHLTDEVGELLSNINTTSLKLKQFLASETAHASTQKQLETAREIQKDFMPQQLPSSTNTQISAICIPAYEVGADWYDAIRINDTVFFIVADVCDKGIPSALYMSVFRTLTRHILLQGMKDYDNNGLFLESVISTVNSYMVENHGNSAMFATMFLGCLEEKDGTLTYVLAGHEAPLVTSSSGNQWLKVSGPAVGIFKGADFKSHSLTMENGSYLLAYTDGLIDARASSLDSWGQGHFDDYTSYLHKHSPTSDELLQWLVEDVRVFTEGVDQFDDLTLMAIRWLKPG